MGQRKKIIIVLLVSLILFGTLSKTSPIDADLKTYLFVFSLIYLISMFVIWFILDLAYHKSDRHFKLVISVILAFVPLLILAISSLSSLSSMDVLLSSIIPLIVIWYIYKRRENSR